MAKMKGIDKVIEGLLIFRSAGVKDILGGDNFIAIPTQHENVPLLNDINDFNRLKLYQLGWGRDKHGIWSINL